MFDPYHKWLGITPKDQPPNHYRLLAIDLFESDPEVIDAGANRQMAYLQQRATGEHAALSQKLLNEIAAARLCLLNAKQKNEYDAELKAKLAERDKTVERPSPDLSEIISSPIADVLSTPTFPRLVRPARTRRSFRPELWHYAVVIGVVGLLGIGGWAIFHSSHTLERQLAIREPEQLVVPQGKEAAAFSSGTPIAASPSQIGETKTMATSPSPPPPSPVKTDASVTPPSGEGKDGWTDLFDGRTLEGWEADRNPHVWSVVDGAIVGRGRSGESSHLFHRAEFKDFQIEAEVKINETGNSGLYLRASREERNGAPDGYEIQIIGEVAGRGAPRTLTGSVFGFNTTGRLDTLAKVSERLTTVENWFKLQVTANGNHIVVKINNQQVADCLDPRSRYQRGHFALQSWNADTDVWFRNLRLRVSPFTAEVSTGSGGRERTVGTEVDLLKLVKPEEHTIRGTWRFDGTTLIGERQNEGPSVVLVPYRPSGEYELQITARNPGDGSSLIVGLVYEETQTAAFLSVHKGSWIKGLKGDKNSRTFRPIQFFEGDTPSRITCTVKMDRILVKNDVGAQLEWEGDYGEFVEKPLWWADIPDKQLFLGTWGDFEISEMKLVPLKAKE